MKNTFDGFDFFLSQIKPDLKDLTDNAFTHLLEQYQAIIAQVENHLIAAAREQKNDHEKAYFIAAMEQCLHMKNAMITAFGHGMMEALKPLSGHVAETQPQLSFQASVHALDSHAREDEIFMLNATTRTYKHYEEVTDQITEALVKILPESRFNHHNNPFNSMIIGNAIFTSLKITNMHPMAKKEILTLFDFQLLRKLDSFYKTILQDLRDTGIRISLTDINTNSSTDNDLLQPEAPELDTIASDFNALLEDNTIPPGHNLAHYTSMEALHADNVENKILRLSPGDIDELLENIQKGYDPESDGPLPAYIRSILELESRNSAIKILRRQDENIINLISLIFDHIAEGQDKRMADLFYRLKVPYARIAITDALFFHDTSHPARQLLDAILALTYSSHDHDTLYKQIQSCVMKILLRYKGEFLLFADLEKTVNGYLQDNRKPFAESIEAIHKKLEAQERKRSAHASVSALIQQRQKHLSHHLRFHILTEKLMTEVLSNILLAEGNESQTWKIGTKLLDIILILTGRSDSPHFKTVANDINNVIRKLSQFLAEHGIKPEYKKVFLEQLLEIHNLLKQGKKLNDLDDDELSHTFDVDMIIDDYDSEMVGEIETALIGSEHKKYTNAEKLVLMPEHKRPQKDSIIAFIKTLKLGQWMSFVVNRERIACSPSYYSKQKDAYIFCDRYNKKLFERTRSEIAEDISSGFACPLSSILSFDGNLAQVINRLHNPE